MENKVIELYQSGLSINAISGELQKENIKMGRVKIRGILTRAGVEIRGNGGSKSLSDEDKEKVVKLYVEENKTLAEIGALLNKSPNTIRKVLVDRGIDRKTAGEYADPELIHDYFETIDTETKAYLLGFIIADGAVIDRKDSSSFTIGIDISNKDRKIVELFKSEVRSSNSFYYNEKRDTIQFRITSSKMASDLSKYGVVPNKTFISYIPEVDEELRHHLIRGLFDGDGSISHFTRTGRKNSSKSVQIGGTKELVDKFSEIVSESAGIKRNVNTKSGSIYVTGWAAKEDINKIYEYMYKDSTIYLERKKIIFEEDYII